LVVAREVTSRETVLGRVGRGQEADHLGTRMTATRDREGREADQTLHHQAEGEMTEAREAVRVEDTRADLNEIVLMKLTNNYHTN